MFDPTCICTTAPANLAPFTEDLKHIYPSSPHNDSGPKHTVPLPTLSEDSPLHANSPYSCHLTPLAHLSHSPKFLKDPLRHTHLPKIFLFSLHPCFPWCYTCAPEATTCYTLNRVVDTYDDAEVELDTADNESQSSSSPDEPPPFGFTHSALSHVEFSS